VGPRALSAGTLEEGLVLDPAIATFASCWNVSSWHDATTRHIPSHGR
jgi:hypothetical protein